MTKPAEQEVPSREPEQIGSRDLTDWPTRLGRALVRAAVELARRVPWVGRVYGWSMANVAFVVFAAGAFVVALLLTKGAGEVYEGVVDRNGISTIDQPVLDAAVSLRSPGLDNAVTWFTDVGGPVGMPILAALVIGGLSVRWRTWHAAVVTVVAAAGALLLTVLGKVLTARDRPPMSLAVPPYESSASFPSGHTLNATVVTAIVAYFILLRTERLWQRVLTVGLAGVFVASMGLSRVFLGHHWLTDVIAGWALGLAWALAAITGHRLWLTLARRQEHLAASAPVRSR